MMTYPEWRAILRASLPPGPIQPGVRALAERVVAEEGVSCSVWTLRRHVDGGYEDVGLTLARAVLRVIDREDENDE